MEKSASASHHNTQSGEGYFIIHTRLLHLKSFDSVSELFGASEQFS